MVNLPMGGRYCSTMMVDRGNALVFERISAKIATAVVNGSVSRPQRSRRGGGEVHSTIDPGCLPSLTLCRFPNALEGTRSGSTRRMHSIFSNLHSFIVLPFDLLQCHPSRRKADQRTFTPHWTAGDSSKLRRSRSHFASDAGSISSEMIFGCWDIGLALENLDCGGNRCVADPGT